MRALSTVYTYYFLRGTLETLVPEFVHYILDFYPQYHSSSYSYSGVIYFLNLLISNFYQCIGLLCFFDALVIFEMSLMRRKILILKSSVFEHAVCNKK